MDIRSQEYRRSQKGSRLGQVARTVGLAVFATLCFLNHANNKSKEAAAEKSLPTPEKHLPWLGKSHNLRFPPPPQRPGI